MFRLFTAFLLVIIIGWIIRTLACKSHERSLAWKKIGESCRTLIADFKRIRSWSASDVLHSARKLVLPLLLFCVLVLALTGFLPYLISGKPLFGFILVLHVAISPVFAICITTASLLWAYSNRFDVSDQTWLERYVLRRNTRKKPVKNHTESKIFFWLIVVLAPVVMGSIVLSMYPIFGTHGQESLLVLHRISALAFLVVSLLFVYLFIDSGKKPVGTGKSQAGS